MATRLGNQTIVKELGRTPDGEFIRVKTDTADVTVHKDVLERNRQGSTFSFGAVKFETEFDRRAREKQIAAGY